jgi:aldehyde:ferredoxin oxidoreductase
MNLGWSDLLRASERVYNLTRAYAAREVAGFGRSHDYPPERFYTEPVETGVTKGSFIRRETLDQLLDDYYEQRGWGSAGLPTVVTLERLGLGDVADELKALGRID